jgi:DNA repair ATPase RecN
MSLTFDKIAKLDNGARFFSADVHVHSYGASDDVKDPGMTVQAIIDAAVRQKISILAITDHNTDVNVVPALDYATRYAHKLIVIPGVEITTANGHLLVYFPPEHPGRLRDLIGAMKIEGKPGARESHTAMSMASVMVEAERLGGICIAAHVDRDKTGFEAMQNGYQNAKKDTVASSGLFGFEFDDPNHLMWYSVDDEPTPSGAERKKLLLAREKKTATAARTRLAAVQNSDAHTLKEFETQHTKRFLSRYKMQELSFDGFRTALIDAEARVRAVVTIPTSFPRVLGMHVTGGFLDGGTLHFSDNLNSFIGGRGTGKSTAIQSLAYGLGLNNDFDEQDNCPDTVVIYCEDTSEVRYRYERNRGREVVVQAKEDNSISDVPMDSFRVEFYEQGELGEVAKDPLGNPELLQEFLDRHIALEDLRSEEQELLDRLSQNSAELIPLEAAASQLKAKEKELVDINKKIQLAETGKLKDFVAFQSGVAAQKTLASTLREIESTYSRGVSLAKFQREYATIAKTAGSLTADPDSTKILSEVSAVVTEANTFIAAEEQRTNSGLADFGKRLAGILSRLDARHRELDQEVTAKIAAFQKQGLTGDLAGLNTLLKRRTQLSGEVARITAQSPELQQARTTRNQLLMRLRAARETIGRRRKDQLTTINKQLRQTIDDYTINLYYDAEGITADFCNLVLEVMQGTYFQEDVARVMCAKTHPLDLAAYIQNGDEAGIAKLVGDSWVPQVLKAFQILKNLHALEVIAKPEKPVIKVLTKGTAPKQIPVNQLSDGQKHTILLTIAMLAESNLPLVIDQPEDNLDNAFIFSSVVRTLRHIKERRQVILVTHNANIAVLGDSELIFPMKRVGSCGDVFDRGSIDRKETSEAVQNILEGGRLAFQRRKEIYGY